MDLPLLKIRSEKLQKIRSVALRVGNASTGNTLKIENEITENVAGEYAEVVITEIA